MTGTPTPEEVLVEDLRLDLERVVGAPVTDSLVLPRPAIDNWTTVLFEFEGGEGRRVFEIGAPTDRPVVTSRPRYVELLPHVVAPLADLRRARAALARCVEASLVDPASVEDLDRVLAHGVSTLGDGWRTDPVTTSLTTAFLEDLLAGAPREWARRRALTGPVTA